jgi:serine/threonine protein kinase
LSSEAGRVFGGRYEVTGPLASGGMAEVFVAQDQLLGRTVAIKILHPEFARDPSFVERFRREAQSAASLNDPRIVAIYDWGTDDSTYYLVMEFVDGKSLKELIQGEGPFTPERAEEIVAEVSSALQYAHAHGIVHRDVKPANIMLTADGRTKVMDFGIARAMADAGATVTQTGTVLGTANYLSPEQAQALPVDARSDVYSTGVVLYEMLTGEVPFKADTAVAIAYKHVREAPKAPSLLAPEVSPALDAVVLKALAKNPDNRYQSAEELRLDLQRLLAGQAVEATPLLPADQTVVLAPVAGRADSTTVIQTITPGGPPVGPPPPSRRNLAYALLLILIAAILIGVAALVYNALRGGTKSVIVPSVVNMPYAAAQSLLSSKKLTAQNNGSVASSTVPSGDVVSQDPAANQKAAQGSTVGLTLSSGSPNGQVPAVVGESPAQAVTDITNAGFRVNGAPVQEYSNSVAQGQVTRTDPPAGTQEPKGATVTIYVSGGKQTSLLPNVVTLTQAQANAQLTAAGFTSSVAPGGGCDATQAPNVVLSQSPGGNQQEPQGTNVALSLNQAKQINDVVGMTQAAAVSSLQGEGFQVQVQTQSSLTGNNTVTSENPPAGQVACPNSTVTILVTQPLVATSPPPPSPSTPPSPSPKGSPPPSPTPF